MRGEDHVANTPRQLLIQQCLNLTSPMYGHIPLIVSSDKSPLSKRLGSWSIREMGQQGYLPIALINYLARLGHTYQNNGLMSMEELAANFSIESLGRAPAHFDATQLLHWQREAIMKTDLPSLKKWLMPAIAAIVPAAQLDAFVEMICHNCVFPSEAAAWAKRLCEDPLVFDEESAKIIRDTPQAFFITALEMIKAHGIDYAQFMDALKQNTPLKGKALFQPLRVALTGVLHGPEMADVMRFLGKERVLARFEQASAVCK